MEQVKRIDVFGYFYQMCITKCLGMPQHVCALQSNVEHKVWWSRLSEECIVSYYVIEVYEISRFLLHTTNFNANMNSMFKFYRREINHLSPVRNSCHCKFLYMILGSSFLSWSHCIKHFEVWSSTIYAKMIHATKTCWKNKTVCVLLCW